MTENKSRVALLYGGTWDERNISVASAACVARALAQDGLPVSPVRWDSSGWCLLPDFDPDLPDAEAVLREPGVPRSPMVVLEELLADGLGVVFNSLHGGPGEDGTIQGFLETAGVPYTGAGVHGSAISGNKESFRHAVLALGFDVADGAVIQRFEWEEALQEVLTVISVEVGFPAIVKPLTSGSSYGVSKIEDSVQLQERLSELFERERAVLIEKFINGREVSVACLGTRVGSPPQTLPIAEIEPLTETGIFDLEAKYDPTKAREIVPAPLEDDLAEHLETLAATVHERLELGGMSRTDIVLGADGPVVLETNSVPGLTAESIFPKTAAAVGLNFTLLCRRLIDYALSAHLNRGANAVS